MQPSDEHQPGRKGNRKLSDGQVAILCALTLEYPLVTQPILARLLARQTGVTLCKKSLYNYLRRAGVRTRYQSQRPRLNFTVPAGQNCADDHPGALSDYEWSLVEDLFVPARRGYKRLYPVRSVVESCRYVMITGMKWSSLPAELPPWRAVYKRFRLWMDRKVFDVMNERLKAPGMLTKKDRTEEQNGHSLTPSHGLG